jgi:hypothetical protein
MWEFVTDGIMVPNGRVIGLYDIGATGRVACHFPQSDFSDSRLRCYIEFLSVLVDVPIESGTFYRSGMYSKVAIVSPPYYDTETDVTLVFPEESLPFVGQVYELFREQ